MNNIKKSILISFLTSFALLAGAYIGQYGFHLYPCEMCWWQRYPHFAAIIFAVIGYMMLHRKNPGLAKFLALIAAISVMISGLIGGFHAGVEYGWWQGLTACSVPIGNGANFLEALENAPIVRCDVAPWDLFGISLAGYNFLISLGAAILSLKILFRSQSVIKG
ncbi:disulfide bond formation protein B [Sphingorhabdus lutea]|uniref:Disulfide bond formation protein B n=1 Tax=Sphingorhabdus lutea TaxID=1913578 RepID=A0A1L3JBJ9_9SPHN|nr:disulfide bond formation protein B [Sphingorhabdus lutea]APG62469.1 disulfide bond formation protein B [Sphingorhabdus lutea]